MYLHGNAQNDWRHKRCRATRCHDNQLDSCRFSVWFFLFLALRGRVTPSTKLFIVTWTMSSAIYSKNLLPDMSHHQRCMVWHPFVRLLLLSQLSICVQFFYWMSCLCTTFHICAVSLKLSTPFIQVNRLLWYCLQMLQVPAVCRFAFFTHSIFKLGKRILTFTILLKPGTKTVICRLLFCILWTSSDFLFHL